MESDALYLFIADVILATHALFVAFVVFGLVSVFVGHALSWAWVRNRLFRLAHLVAIAVVVLQTWFGKVCFLTNWEMALRERVGDAVYSGTFVSHWLQTILYYRAPHWVFVVVYTVFAALVAASWFWIRPRPFAGGRSQRDS